jgi:hypothetical protein
MIHTIFDILALFAAFFMSLRFRTRFGLRYPAGIRQQYTHHHYLFEKDQDLQQAFFNLFSLDACGEQTTDNLHTMLCCLPQIYSDNISYEQVFRLVIMKFMDAYDFDLGSVKRSCVHAVEPDGKIYPFDTWNLFGRWSGEGA